MNLINVEDVETFAAGLAGRVAAASAKRWFKRNLRNHLLREPGLAVPIEGMDGLIRLKLEGRIRKVPDWAERAVRRGDDLRFFAPEGLEHWDTVTDFVQAMHGVADWLNALPKTDKHWKRLDKLAVDEAIGLSRRWHASLARRASDDWPEDWDGIETAHRFPDGVKIVRLTTELALDREGNIMGHCVGKNGYDAAVTSGEAEIYSLRDVRNIPHATIEVRRGSALQIKGTANTAPIERWAEYVRSFVVAKQWRVSHDGEAIGMVTVSGRTYGDPRELVADLPRIGRTEDAAFRVDGVSQVLRYASRWSTNAGDSGECARNMIFQMLAPDSDEIRVTEEGSVLEAAGLRMSKRTVVLPAAIMWALRYGMLRGLEDRIAEACRPAAEAALRLAEAHPDTIHKFELSAGCGDGVAAEQYFGFCGLYADYARISAACLAHKRRLASDATAKIRRLLNDSVRGKAPAPKDRDGLTNAVNVQLPRLATQVLVAPGIA